jgi:hypothetical protein
MMVRVRDQYGDRRGLRQRGLIFAEHCLSYFHATPFKFNEVESQRRWRLLSAERHLSAIPEYAESAWVTLRDMFDSFDSLTV